MMRRREEFLKNIFVCGDWKKIKEASPVIIENNDGHWMAKASEHGQGIEIIEKRQISDKKRKSLFQSLTESGGARQDTVDAAGPAVRPDFCFCYRAGRVHVNFPNGKAVA